MKIYVAGVEALRKRERLDNFNVIDFCFATSFFEPSKLGGGSLFFNERKKRTSVVSGSLISKGTFGIILKLFF